MRLCTAGFLLQPSLLLLMLLLGKRVRLLLCCQPQHLRRRLHIII
jgi:hypothetical protein